MEIHKGTVRVLNSWLSPRVKVSGWIVNEVFAVVYHQGAWQVVHQISGLSTCYRTGRKKSDVIALAYAATRKFSAQTLALTDPHRVITALRDAGSVTWSRAWWQRRRLAARKA